MECDNSRKQNSLRHSKIQPVAGALHMPFKNRTIALSSMTFFPNGGQVLVKL